jgi:hypothetical protein
MPNIPPLISAMPNSQSLYAPYTPAVPVFPAGFGVAGVASNITWGSAGGAFVLGAISVPGLTDTSIVMATIQAMDATELPAGYPVIVEATPSVSSGGQIRIVLSKVPLVTANLYIAWQVLKYTR